MSPGSKEQACFHCGLPVPDAARHSLPVLGRPRVFCCRGCLEVCRAIVDAGLEDYYAHRERSAVTADRVPEILNKLELYDRPAVQKGFVRERGTAMEAALVLENIRCAACLWLNERHLRSQPGVLDVEIDYASQHARVRWDPAQTRLSRILHAVADIGYLAHPYDPSQREQLLREQRRRSTERLIFAGVIGMMVMQFALGTYIMDSVEATEQLPLWVQIGRWTSLVAATALLAYPGQEFFVGAWQDLSNRRLGMDVPIVLGLATAWVGSLYATLTGRGDVYFDSIAMFVFFLLIARRAESRARLRAADALDRLRRVIPRTARRLGHAGAEEEVLVVDLEVGDRVRVLPGEVVPADAVLREGASSFDESLLSGEPWPVEREPGDAVIGGSCNVSQPVLVEVSRTGSDTTAAEVHALLQHGLHLAPQSAQLAQRVALWFVAAVLVIAAVTATTWIALDPGRALSSTIAVLIVTCPCALALATPVALAISAGRFAEIGILPLRMSEVETLARASVVAFDKTGTLTLGRPHIVERRLFAATDPDTAVRIAAALERHSRHPVARAFEEAGRRLSFDIEAASVTHSPAAGVSGLVEGVRWQLGKPEFVSGQQRMNPEVSALVDRWRGRGLVVIALAREGRVHALFGLNDEPRPGLQKMLDELRRQGISEMAVLSGDSRANTSRLANRFGIEEGLGDLAPADKLDWIGRAQARGKTVIMLGDGINDAPTLAAANVSLSFAEATELAQVHSDFLLMTPRIGVVGEALGLARRTHRIIRQNLAWAAGYNLLAVPAAALGYIPPWGAAIGMSLSSLLVVGNAWRLRRTRRGDPVLPVKEGHSTGQQNVTV